MAMTSFDDALAREMRRIVEEVFRVRGPLATQEWRGIRVEGEAGAYINANVSDAPDRGLTEAVMMQACGLARSCPTCGPRPGGPLSAPLNATDKSCWRCGRTDLVGA